MIILKLKLDSASDVESRALSRITEPGEDDPDKKQHTKVNILSDKGHGQNISSEYEIQQNPVTTDTIAYTQESRRVLP